MYCALNASQCKTRAHVYTTSRSSNMEFNISKISCLMNHKRYFYNLCIILKILNYVTFRSHFVHIHNLNHDLSFQSKAEVLVKQYLKELLYGITLNRILIFQKLISHKPHNIFSQSLHYLKDLELFHILFTDMT